MKPVLMCGGIGSKMWPASRMAKPKHFLPLVEGKSLFEINYEILRKKFEPNEIYVSTTESQYGLAKKMIPDVPDGNFFLEPDLRNTGPAIGFMAAKLYKKFADEVFVVIQTDIIRQPGEKFLEMLDKMEKIVLREKRWVTGAIKPPFLMRGVDYMVSGDKVEDGVWQLSDWLMRDKEKDIKKAMDNGKAWLHANHYAWTPRLWLESYLKHMPEWGKPLMEIATGGDEKKIYPDLAKGPTENWTIKSVANGEGAMMELPFTWWDLGTWESLSNYLDKKSDRGYKNVLEIDSTGNFYRIPSGKFVASIGVSDVVLVETEDAILICKKDQTGRVGEVVDYLKEKDRKELL